MDWTSILRSCGVHPNNVSRWTPVFAAEIGPTTFSAGLRELPDFLGQILHESVMLDRVLESLTYTTAARIRAVWPSRFPTEASAQPFVRNPQELAEAVYGGRMGNVRPGDGWRFRGRGLLQVTGRDNYRTVGRALGIDLEALPDALAEPAWALRSAIAWWERNIPDAIIGDVQRITRRVNGGKHGLDERVRLARVAERAIAGAA